MVWCDDSKSKTRMIDCLRSRGDVKSRSYFLLKEETPARQVRGGCFNALSLFYVVQSSIN